MTVTTLIFTVSSLIPRPLPVCVRYMEAEKRHTDMQHAPGCNVQTETKQAPPQIWNTHSSDHIVSVNSSNQFCS